MPDQKALVINTGPLIALVAATGDLEILRDRYARIVVPFEVAQEILTGGSSGFAVPELQAADFLENNPARLRLAPSYRTLWITAKPLSSRPLLTSV